MYVIHVVIKTNWSKDTKNKVNHFSAAVPCPDVDPPILGVINGTYNKWFGEEVTFECNPGHDVLSGDFNRTCQANQTWTGTRLECACKFWGIYAKYLFSRFGVFMHNTCFQCLRHSCLILVFNVWDIHAKYLFSRFEACIQNTCFQDLSHSFKILVFKVWASHAKYLFSMFEPVTQTTCFQGLGHSCKILVFKSIGSKKLNSLDMFILD